jgi:sugar phosphate isomerase/epimerase
MVKIGMALYSVRGEMGKDPMKTLQRVSELGYKYIESANHRIHLDSFLSFDITPEKFNEFAKEHDLKLINTHIGRSELYAKGSVVDLSEYPQFVDYTEDDVKRVAESHLKAGNHRLTSAVFYFPNNVNGILSQCEKLQKWNDAAKSVGSKLLYHAHYQEFIKVKGKLVLDYLIENTDINLELDTYWAMRSGEDPIDMIKHFANRIELIHQKDYSAYTPIPVVTWDIFGQKAKNGFDHPNYEINNRRFFSFEAPETFAEIGTGIMPIQKIIDAVNKYTKAEYIILEQDYNTFNDEFLSAEVSMQNFKKMKGISWD